MRSLVVCCIALSILGFGAVDEKKPPGRLILKAKPGDVAFDHAAHAKRENGDCAACHDKLVPQSANAAMKSASACGPCHRAGGRAFEMKGNCARCHGNAAGVERQAAHVKAIGRPAARKPDRPKR